MNGIHDMGGMHGMGPVQYEKNEPVFHSGWESRVFALMLAMGAWGKWNIDASRHSREVIPPDEYLRMSYYEKWYAGLIGLLINSSLVTRTEVESGAPAPGLANSGSHAPATLRARKSRYDRTGSWRLCFSGHQRSFPRRETAACILGALRRA